MTSKYINNSKVICGPHLSGIRGKTVIYTPRLVDSDFVEIPRDFQLFNKSVTLVANVFF